ncbi:MAG: pectate lyase family protein [Caulobacterales bacterium]
MPSEQSLPLPRFYIQVGAFLAAIALLTAGAGCTTPQQAPSATAGETQALAQNGVYFAPSGWEAITTGGAGGRIIRVTTLDGAGAGSLRAALNETGPRIIVFEVGGVIDLERQTLLIREPNVTIAGQTAPSPGVTLIRGGIDVRANDVIIQHIRVRPGDVGDTRGSGWAEDSIATIGAAGVIVDHCSLTWGTDENLSASGPRFTGATPEEWRQGTSRRILFSHNIIAEGLADSTHPKFEHSKGSLIHDNISDILIFGNLYAHNMERSPLFKGGVHGAIVSNFIYDPGQRAIHYNLQALEWGSNPFQPGEMSVLNNVMRGGPSTQPGLPMIMIGGDGDLRLFERGNIAVDRWGQLAPVLGRYTTSSATVIPIAAPLPSSVWLPQIQASRVEAYVLANAGARPWDRDRHDVRILANAAEGRGEIIDSQDEVGGYPIETPTFRPFDPSFWNLQSMTPLSPAVLDQGAAARGT